MGREHSLRPHREDPAPQPTPSSQVILLTDRSISRSVEETYCFRSHQAVFAHMARCARALPLSAVPAFLPQKTRASELAQPVLSRICSGRQCLERQERPLCGAAQLVTYSCRCHLMRHAPARAHPAHMGARCTLTTKPQVELFQVTNRQNSENEEHSE